MSHKNYSKFSKHFDKDQEQNPVAINFNDNIIDGQIVIDEIVEETVSEVEEVKVETVKGFVFGCEKLNMRKEANKESEVVTVLSKDTEIEVNLTDSTDDFYKIVTPMGFEGFYMKKFISVK